MEAFKQPLATDAIIRTSSFPGAVATVWTLGRIVEVSRSRSSKQQDFPKESGWNYLWPTEPPVDFSEKKKLLYHQTKQNAQAGSKRLLFRNILLQLPNSILQKRYNIQDEVSRKS